MNEETEYKWPTGGGGRKYPHSPDSLEGLNENGRQQLLGV